MRDLINGMLLFLAGQILIWYQTNLQFMNDWFKDHPLFTASIFSIPISYMFIKATAFVVSYFDGLLWPGRFIGFSMGMLCFALLSYVHMGEGISAKTGVSLVLALTLVCVQVFWK